MNCTDVQDLMAGFVAHEISMELSKDVTQHIKTCEVCRIWHEEVLESTVLWQDNRPVPGLDLATSVIQQLALRASHSGDCGEPSTPSLFDVSVLGHVPPRLTKQPERKSHWNLYNIAFLHYGVAASITMVLFQFGVFQRLGMLAAHGVMLSNEIHILFVLLSNHSY